MDEFTDKKVIGQPVFGDFGNQGKLVILTLFIFIWYSKENEH